MLGLWGPMVAPPYHDGVWIDYGYRHSFLWSPTVNVLCGLDLGPATHILRDCAQRLANGFGWRANVLAMLAVAFFDKPLMAWFGAWLRCCLGYILICCEGALPITDDPAPAPAYFHRVRTTHRTAWYNRNALCRAPKPHFVLHVVYRHALGHTLCRSLLILIGLQAPVDGIDTYFPLSIWC